MSEANEQFYDDVIAPALAGLAQQCADRGMSFVASVEWSPGDTGSTVLLAEGHGSGIHTTAYSASCNSNVDALLLDIMKRARKTGHSSLVLAQLGVPLTPVSEGSAA